MNYIPFTYRFRNFLWIICLLITTTSSAQSESEEMEKIKSVLEEQQTHWNDGNIEAYMEGYWKSDSLLFVGSKGPTYGWENTLNNYLKAYPSKQKMGQLTFHLKSLKLLNPELAFVVGKWQLSREEGDLKGYFTLIWRKLGEETHALCTVSSIISFS